MLATIIVIAFSGSDSGAAGTGTPSVNSRAQAGLASVSAPVQCPGVLKALRYYRDQYSGWLEKRGAEVRFRVRVIKSCPRYLLRVTVAKARGARIVYERWYAYHWDWATWLPDKWARIGACETGYGRRPGSWTWNSGTYQGAFGFYHGSWDAFVGSANPKAGPYPSEAYNATPRQQYEVALAIWRRYGFSGWGCRGA